jgi:hypothetical protein
VSPGDPHIISAHRRDDYESFLGPDASAMFAQHTEGMRQQLEPIMDALKSAVEFRGEDSHHP